MALLPPSHGANHGAVKGVPDMIAYRATRYHVARTCSYCTIEGLGALSVNGICFASCNGVECNEKIIEFRLKRAPK